MFGSSPRMWGTRGNNRALNRIARFIPTHVGNTHDYTLDDQTTAVHPHACGEHRSVCGFVLVSNGSSPRMWGTLRRDSLQACVSRFIPTHVGNTAPPKWRTLILAVHPHACGEHKIWFILSRSMSGSSPRMWGTRQKVMGALLSKRFIPTHVGNTHQAVCDLNQ